MSTTTGFASTLRRPTFQKPTRYSPHSKSCLDLSSERRQNLQETVRTSKLCPELRQRLIALKQKEELKGLVKADINAKNRTAKAGLQSKGQRTHKEANHRRDDEAAPSNFPADDPVKADEVSERSSKLGPRKETDFLDRFKEFHWGQLDEYATHVHEEEHKKVKECAIEQRREFKKCLDKQIQERRTHEIQLKKQEASFNREAEEKVAAWCEVEKAKTKQLKEKLLAEKSEQDKQLQLIRNQRQEEARRAVEEQRRLIEKGNQQRQAEEAADKIVKLQKKKAATEIMKQNEAYLIEKAKLRKKEQLEDLRLVAENKRIEEERETQKRQELERRVRWQKQMMDRMKETVFKQQDLKATADARKAQQHQETLSAKDEAQKAAKIEKLRQQNEEIKMYLSKQVTEKREAARAEKENRRREAEALQVGIDKYVESEKSKSAECRMRNVDYKNALARQIQNKQVNSFSAMTNTELRLNRSLLLKVEPTLEAAKVKNAAEKEKTRSLEELK